MPKLRDVDNKDVIRLLKTLGYEQVAQRGSHIKFRATFSSKTNENIISVPAHDPLDIGTLNSIIGKISEQTGISKEQLKIELYKQHSKYRNELMHYHLDPHK